MLPEEHYNMQHDIYSIGVVLLEIGLWTSFVSYPTSLPSSDHPIPTTTIDLLTPAQEKDSRLRAFRNKKILEDVAERELPSKFGRKYTNMVLWCLRCLDTPDGVGGGDDGDDGVDVGVGYAETVLELAHAISL